MAQYLTIFLLLVLIGLQHPQLQKLTHISVSLDTFIQQQEEPEVATKTWGPITVSVMIDGVAQDMPISIETTQGEVSEENAAKPNYADETDAQWNTRSLNALYAAAQAAKDYTPSSGT